MKVVLNLLARRIQSFENDHQIEAHYGVVLCSTLQNGVGRYLAIEDHGAQVCRLSMSMRLYIRIRM